jgi:hypothetical protein
MRILTIDPLGLGLGVLLIVFGVVNFVRRDEVATRLAAYYARGRTPAWLPRVLRARWGIGETRFIAWAVAGWGIGVGPWLVAQSGF